MSLEAAQRFGDRLAVIAPGAQWTYADLARRVETVAGALSARGVVSGSLVALWAPNSPEWVVAAHAAWRCGATLLPLSVRWTDAEAGAALSRLKPVLVMGDAALAERAAGLGHPAIDWAGMGATGGPAAPALPELLGPMAILLTSGTSGAPKAAALSWRAMAAGADAVGAAIALGPDDRWWLGMPFSHVGGLSALLRCARFGAAAIVADRFGAESAWAELEGHGATVASFVPTMVQALDGVRGERPWPATLRLAMVGGAAAPDSLLARCPVAVGTYGLTEACATVTLGRVGDAATAGAPLPGVVVAIWDAEGQPVPMGEAGEIVVAGPSLMDGYVGDPDATAEVLVAGWLRTGDFGRLDAAGRLVVLGRRTDLIVSGGENIYPAEVEAVLSAHPHVAAAAVVAAPSARWGQSPFAFIQVTEAALDAAALEPWLGERLARFKHPRGYAFVQTLPLLGNGKVDRRALAAELSERGYELT